MRKKKQIIDQFRSIQKSIIGNFTRDGIPTTEEEYRKYYCSFENVPFAFTDIEMIFNEESCAVDWIFRYGNPALARLEKLPLKRLIGSSFGSLFSNMDSKWLRSYEQATLYGKILEIIDYSTEIDTYLKLICFPTFKGHCGCILFDISEIQFTKNSSNAESGKIPTLGKVRGKIVFIRRLSLSNSCIHDLNEQSKSLGYSLIDAFGPDASLWDENAYSAYKNAQQVGDSNVYVQDNYGEDDADTKYTYFTGTIDDSTEKKLTADGNAYLFNYSVAKDNMDQPRAINDKMPNLYPVLTNNAKDTVNALLNDKGYSNYKQTSNESVLMRPAMINLSSTIKPVLILLQRGMSLMFMLTLINVYLSSCRMMALMLQDLN